VWNLTPRLEGRIVTLEPLGPEHRDALVEAAQPQQTWDWWSVDMSTPQAVSAWVDSSLEAAERGERAPFATLDSYTAKPIGSTSFMTLRPEHASLEIGWTWLTPSAWNSGANIEAKLLMLRHAFTVLGCQRVEFITHEQNERSRRALAALPAKEEGILREHRILWDGARRSSALYSILDHEWPSVETSLETRLSTR
jgi:RimJ/RimL family protein N-acetyltransferase